MTSISGPSISNSEAFTPVVLQDARKGKNAFTLIEVLVVMLIIAILLTLIVGIAAYAMRSAQEKKAVAQIEKMNLALQEYNIKYGRYPDCHNPAWPSIIAGQLPDSASVISNDPWGTHYKYTTPDDRYTYTLSSAGKDKTNGTSDDISTGR